jgi:hypothetical protein
VLLFYSFLCTIFFSSTLLADRLLAPGDGILYYLPAFYAPRTLWTSLLLSGFPVGADPQIQSWYPLKYLFSHFKAWNSFVISAYILASCFAYSYVYALVKSCFASLISGIIYGMSGFLIAHLGHTTMIHTAMWLPLLILAQERLRHQLTIHWFVIASLSITCSFMAGHTQIFVYSLGISVAYAMAFGWSAATGRWRYYMLYLTILSIGLSMGAIQLLPSSELAGEGLRSKLSFSEFVSYSLPPYQAIGLLFPYLFGGSPHSYTALPWFGEWNATELTGYVGLLSLMIALIGLIRCRHSPMVWFWSSVGLLAFLLTLGDAIPLAKLMYHLPIYNKFRAPVRHFFELSLAMSVLAGMGIAVLERQVASKSLIFKVTAAGASLLLIGLFGIFWFQNDLHALAFKIGITKLPLSPWSNPAIGLPLVLFLLNSIILFYWSRKSRSKARQILLMSMLIIDLGSFGWDYEWQHVSPKRDWLALSADAKRYKEILVADKQRLLPIDWTAGLDPAIIPNISRIWDIPSATGYGPLITQRVSELLSMNQVGVVLGRWWSPTDLSLDLLAVRYVFFPRTHLQSQSVLHSWGLAWAEEDLQLNLGSGCGVERPDAVKLHVTQQFPIRAIGIVSMLACSTRIRQGEEILKLSIINESSDIDHKYIYAGKDTSEMAYECDDVAPLMLHSKANIFNSILLNNCQGHRYVTIVTLERDMKIEYIELQRSNTNGEIRIDKISLLDSSNQQSYPIIPVELALGDTTRWRFVEEIGGTKVYENLRAMPRAWLVPELVSLAPADILRSIKTSRLLDGRGFDPFKIALVEEKIAFKADHDKDSSVDIIDLSDNSITIKTKSKNEAVLVLSDVYYPGWRATVDESVTKILRLNYILRGVLIPSGEHMVKFEFRPRIFYRGAIITGSGAFTLVIGSTIVAWWKRWNLRQSNGVIHSKL